MRYLKEATAYALKAYEKPKMDKLGFHFYEDYVRDTEYYILIDDKNKRAYISFRGSDNTQKVGFFSKDWIMNFMFKLKDYKLIRPYGNEKSGVKVHTGFITKWHAIREWILSRISYLITKGIDTIIVSGHSLGGAIACLCSLDIIYNLGNKLKDVFCYVFGCPKVGNKDFVDSFNKRVKNFWSFRNGLDFICNLPPFFWYRKIKKHIVIGTKKWYNFVKDHYPHRYERAMKERVA